MRLYTSYTPSHWEFGFGFYIAAWYENKFTKQIEKLPHEIALLLGPFSICLEIGYNIEVIGEK